MWGWAPPQHDSNVHSMLLLHQRLLGGGQVASLQERRLDGERGPAVCLHQRHRAHAALAQHLGLAIGVVQVGELQCDWG